MGKLFLCSRANSQTQRKRNSSPGEVVMSEDTGTNAADDDAVVAATVDSPPQQAAAPSSNVRTLVLLGLLVLAIASLGYDRLVARPAAEAAHQLVNDKASERSSSANKQLDNSEVAALFEKGPAERLEGDHYYVEKYSWLGGLPFRSYDCWVVYAPSFEGETKTFRFNAAYLNEKPDPQFMPGYEDNVEIVTELPGEPSGAAGPGGGGPPGDLPGPPGGPPPGSRPPGSRPPGDDPDDAPKDDAPKDDAPKDDAPKDDAPKDDAPKDDAPKDDAAEKDAPKKEGA